MDMPSEQPDPEKTALRPRQPPAEGPLDASETVLRSPSKPPETSVEANETILRSQVPPARTPLESTGTSNPASTDEVRLPATDVPVPVYRPRRKLVPYLLGVVLLVAGVILGYVIHPSSSHPPVRPSSLTVDGIMITPPGQLACPTSVAHIVATVTLSGGGLLRFEWRLPDGTNAAPQSLQVSTSQHSVVVPLDYTVSTSGVASFSGIAQLHVLAPADVYSAAIPVALSCH